MNPISKKSHKFILSGGGTGGHIYPAIAIADEIKNRLSNADILFVGAKNKMEMEKAPKAGYPVKGLWISGIQRSNIFANFSFPFKLINSLYSANKIIKSFKPLATIGTGGYASGPIMWAAAKRNIPVLVQEQNSYPGITNKLLKNKAFAICTAYDEMEKYFPKEKIHLTGNPIRNNISNELPEQKEAKKYFNLNPEKPVILSVGGSLGAKSLNSAWQKGINKLIKEDIQLIWQTGKLEFNKINQDNNLKSPNIHITDFIYDMKKAYAAADVIVSRAGAMAISELCLVGKPTILVPFPFAAEDHQTKNAQNLVKHMAAKIISDSEVGNYLVNESIELIENLELRNILEENILRLARPNATKEIVDILFNKLNIS